MKVQKLLSHSALVSRAKDCTTLRRRDTVAMGRQGVDRFDHLLHVHPWSAAIWGAISSGYLLKTQVAHSVTEGQMSHHDSHPFRRDVEDPNLQLTELDSCA